MAALHQLRPFAPCPWAQQRARTHHGPAVLCVLSSPGPLAGRHCPGVRPSGLLLQLGPGSSEPVTVASLELSYLGSAADGYLSQNILEALGMAGGGADRRGPTAGQLGPPVPSARGQGPCPFLSPSAWAAWELGLSECTPPWTHGAPQGEGSGRAQRAGSEGPPHPQSQGLVHPP